jgi:hypothetical protein
MLPQPIRDAAEKIGQFYLQKNNRDYEAAEKELVNIHFTKLDILTSSATNQSTLHITDARVGNVDKISTISKFTKMVKNFTKNWIIKPCK